MSDYDKCVLTAIIVALIWGAWREFTNPLYDPFDGDDDKD